MLLSFLITITVFSSSNAYFTLPGKCPENIPFQEYFKLADFFSKWYQVYHYSSDHQQLNNCSTIELLMRADGIYINQSRIDLGLFQRSSLAQVIIPSNPEEASKLNLKFTFKDAPRRLVTRNYNFRVLSTNYNYYATVYTCQYSPLIDKHFVYIWILSRKPFLNDVSKELAMKSLRMMNFDENLLVKEDYNKCNANYYQDSNVEPTTFRLSVPI